jgi:hypothetical protein
MRRPPFAPRREHRTTERPSRSARPAGLAGSDSGIGSGGRLDLAAGDIRVSGVRGTDPRPLQPAHCLRLRRSPVDGWATYVATAPVLTREGLVNRELLDVRRPLRLDAGGGDCGPDPGLERIEVLA